jgi:hypothetical protein
LLIVHCCTSTVALAGLIRALRFSLFASLEFCMGVNHDAFVCMCVRVCVLLWNTRLSIWQLLYSQWRWIWMVWSRDEIIYESQSKTKPDLVF